MTELTYFLLIGHGGVPTDYPRENLLELKRLEGQRRAAHAPMTDRERHLDREIRYWRRTPHNDPYQLGLDELARALRQLVRYPVRLAYNEFCAPSIQEAIDGAASEGAQHLIVMTSMVTRGGSHAEREIPEELATARQCHPKLRIDYLWPLDPGRVAEMLCGHLPLAARRDSDL